MASMEVEDTKPSRLSVLYPLVDETVTPLPRGWSCIDKFSYIELSHNNLRVHYTGVCGVSVHACVCVCTYYIMYIHVTGFGDNERKDAASVRTPRSIPTSCGVYYFEIKVISKGRDG